jgi:hypothetical protein
MQILSSDSAVLSSDNEVENFLLNHLKKLREIPQLETADFVTIIEQNYGGWVGYEHF